VDLYQKWELWLKALTLLGVITAGVWTAVTYVDSKEKEFYTEFWNKKMALFQKTSNAASTMATASTLKEFNKARAGYWKLFYGELSLFEGACVKQAMVVFSQCVPHVNISKPDLLPFKVMEQPSYRLSIRLQNELANAWENPFSELQLSELPKACNFQKELECLTIQANAP